MKNAIYKLITINDGRSDAAAILKVFSRMAAGRLECDLRLLNYYDEVPVCYDSNIISVGEDSVELEVHEHQALIMKHDKSTLIKSDHFHHGLGVHCYASSVSVHNRTAVLHHFAYAQIRAERREVVRVRVHGTLPVTFSCDNVNIYGDLVDISGSGISITTDLVPTMNTDQPGQLILTLDGTNLTVPGSLVRTDSNGNGGYDCIFQMMPDRVSEDIIGHFIYHRQVEIIQLLKDGLIVD